MGSKEETDLVIVTGVATWSRNPYFVFVMTLSFLSHICLLSRDLLLKLPSPKFERYLAIVHWLLNDIKNLSYLKEFYLLILMFSFSL